MTDIKFTGERLVPGVSPADLEAEHMSRYHFIKNLVKGKKVLDIGCGAGYGSKILSETAEVVIGIDIDKDAISYATEKYGSETVSFVVGDVEMMPFNDFEFEAGVCFEVIEHIERPRAMLTEASRVISGGGLFIISTPNGAVKVSSQPNPYHLREYLMGEFTDLLKQFFPLDLWELKIYGQFLRGKNYSSTNVALKNFYLTMKGKLGIKPSSKGTVDIQKINPEFDFKIEDRDLAEYLIAVIKGK